MLNAARLDVKDAGRNRRYCSELFGRCFLSFSPRQTSSVTRTAEENRCLAKGVPDKQLAISLLVVEQQLWVWRHEGAYRLLEAEQENSEQDPTPWSPRRIEAQRLVVKRRKIGRLEQ